MAATEYTNLRFRAERGERAFTLLEVLLAVSLALVLLSALYAALKLHLTFAQRGPEQVRKALLARGIVQRIARDIRAVVPPALKQESSATTGGSSAASAGSTSSGASSSTASATSSASSATTGTGSTTSTEPDAYRNAYGVLGGTDWLQLYIAEYNPNLDDTELAASSGSVAQMSNIVRVTYAVTVLSTQADSKGRTQRLALVRSEVGSVGAQRLDESGDDSDMRATSVYLCDDLAQLQFQYWDDVTGTWLDYWGVDMPVAPPRAIKVFISLQDPEEYLQSSLGVTGGQSTWQADYQLVIPIATWDPDAESSSSSMESSGG